MSQTSDQSTNPAHHQELNPLLNPLLAENMSRWAEVYFNNPPERREQAVIQLLLELEAERAREESRLAPPPPAYQRPVPAPTIARASQAPAPEAVPTPPIAMVPCERCGRENPATHKFCGMCGGALRSEDENQSPRTEERGSAGDSAQVGSPELSSAKENQAPSQPEAQAPPAQVVSGYGQNDDRPLTSANDVSIFRNAVFRAEEEYDDAADESSHSRSYRTYIGGIVAIVLVALAYTAWRASSSSGNSGQARSSQAPSSQAASAPPIPDQPAKSASAPAPPAPLASSAKSKPSAPAVAADKSAPTAGGGSEELAQAEHYLNGGSGQARDPATAAEWLWKSIGKHNGPATVLLADLYLKGDGVPKNCEQARVLLDSATRKSVPGAADRLRNLPAFGCQ